MMECSIMTKLSKDLIIELSEFLGPRDITSLAATCRSLSDVLTHRLYVNDNKSGRCRALYWSCDCGDLRMLTHTLNAGASVNHVFHGWNPLLLLQVEDERLARVDGPTPLIVASEAGYMQIVNFLLKRGADVNGISHSGFRGPGVSALQSTIRRLSERFIKKQYERQYEYLVILKGLLEAGADPNLRGSPGDRYPLRASLKTHCPAEATSLLLEYGATSLVDGQDQNRWSDFFIEVMESICDNSEDIITATTFATKLDLLFYYQNQDVAMSRIAWKNLAAAIESTVEYKPFLEVFARYGYIADPRTPNPISIVKGAHV